MRNRHRNRLHVCACLSSAKRFSVFHPLTVTQVSVQLVSVARNTRNDPVHRQ